MKSEKKSEYKRPTWDEYFMKMASLVAERSTCLRHHVGAIIVKKKRVLTTGYNGAAKGVKDCFELGCLRDELEIESGTRHEICRAIHAEQNAIIQAGVHGINISGSTMYCTHTPCMICAKMIVNAGIKDVVSYHDYADEEARKFLKEAGINLMKVPKPDSTIDFKD
ncbi:MAG: cytidine/deoxycytidylate deaminase family protein [Nanoarchaeota archaeon]|nr:cytidine/deoxycytidylate deaminase family protein [Nanoarchaeota archaeon]